MKSSRNLLLLGLLLAAVGPLAAAGPWLTDLAAAKAIAAREHKQLLLEFTGSDWCTYCIKLEREVLEKAEFDVFAKEYVLVRLDYPRKKALPPAEKEQNAKLQADFAVDGFPTVITTDAAGKELHRAMGYSPGSGPAAYLATFKR